MINLHRLTSASPKESFYQRHSFKGQPDRKFVWVRHKGVRRLYNMRKLNTYKIISSLIFLIILFCSCDSTEPIIEVNSDVVTLNSKCKGFSFALGSVIPYTMPGSDSSKIITDIQIFATLSGTTIIGVHFSSPDTFVTSFRLMGEFTKSDSALKFFNNLSEVPDSNYSLSANPVKVNQIWAIKTSENKFAKILILNTDVYEYSPAPGFRSYYSEVTFKWKYQSNGSRVF
jgi:hypothetical protein